MSQVEAVRRETAQSLGNHWTDDSDWRPGRRLWAFYLTLEKEFELHRTVAGYQASLRPIQGLDCVDPRWLHITMQGIAFVDNVDPCAIASLIREVGPKVSRMTPPIVTVHPPETTFDSITLPVTPEQPLSEVKRLVRVAGTKILRGRDLQELPQSPDGFRPHISIAYANSDVASFEVSSALSSVPDCHTTVSLNSLCIVQLQREQNRWSWDGSIKLPFGSTSE